MKLLFKMFAHFSHNLILIITVMAFSGGCMFTKLLFIKELLILVPHNVIQGVAHKSTTFERP